MKPFNPKLFILSLILLPLIHYSYAQWNWDVNYNTPICVAAGEQKDARIESDGQGGAFIVWKDYRAGLPDIYVQHVDSNGIIQWTLDGIGACTDAADQSTPSITTDMAGGIIVTWSDWRSFIERDIYAQRIAPNGTMLWQLDGAIVTIQNEREHNERIVSDGAGGCIIAFEKQVGQWDIWAQRLNSTGTTLWGPGGVPVTTFFSNRRNPKLQMDHSHGAYITWQDNRNISYDVYAQRLDANGVRLWGDAALQVTNVIDDQTNPKIDPDHLSGGVYICWADQRSAGGDNDVYCQRIDSLGNFLWPINGNAVCIVPGDQSAVDILSNDGINGVIATWKDGRSDNTDIYAQHLDQNGNALWSLNGIPVCNTSAPQLNPNICGDSHGGAIIAYQDSAVGSIWNISAQRIDTLGVPLWGSGVVVSSAPGSQTSPKNISDRNGGSIFVWEDTRTGIKDIYVHHIGADGTSIGIEENNIQLLNAFPNPFVDKVNIHLNLINQEDLQVNVYSITGEEIDNLPIQMDVNGTNHDIIIDGSSLQLGIYFVQLRGTDSFRTVRVVKQ